MQNPTSKSLYNKISDRLHEIKGGGNMYGFNLITEIAKEADDIFSSNHTLDKKELRILNNHVEALSLIAKYKLGNDGGIAGGILLQGLKDFS